MEKDGQFIIVVCSDMQSLFSRKYLQKKKKLKLFKQKRQLVNVISLALANQMNIWKKTHKRTG